MNLEKLFQPGGILSICVVLGIAAGLTAFGITEQVPLGSIKGQANMAENGKPLAGATLILRPKFDLEGWKSRSILLTAAKDGRFESSQMPAGEYMLEAYTRAHKLENTPVLIEEGQAAVLNLELQPTKPYLDLYASQHVFSPSEEPSMEAHGFTPEQELELKVFSVAFDSIIQKRGLQQLLRSVADRLAPDAYRYSQKTEDPSKSPHFKAVHEERLKITQRDGEGVFVERLKLSTLPEGVYWVEVHSGKQGRGTWLVISKIALVTKAYEGKVSAFVADIETGKPVARASIHEKIGEVLVLKGQTDSNGLLEFSRDKKGEGNLGTLILASHGNSRALTDFFVADAQHSGNSANLKIYAYTDRPVYRPGDKVFFKSVVRQLDEKGEYQLPKTQEVNVELLDGDRNVVAKFSKGLSANGTLSGEFQLERDSLPGNYDIQLRIGNNVHYKTVPIVSYRKPEYKVTIKPEKPYYVRGQKARFIVQADYTSGQPLAGAKVEAHLFRSLLWSGGFWDEEETQEPLTEDNFYGGEACQEFKLETDEMGRAIIEFDPREFRSERKEGSKSPVNEAEDFSDELYMLSAYVSDKGDRYLEAKGVVKVTRGEITLEAKCDRFFGRPGEKVIATLQAKSLADGLGLEKLVIQVEHGYWRWENKSSYFVREGVGTVTTNHEGKASIEFSPNRSGSYVLRAWAQDNRGNKVRCDSWYWVSDGSASDFGEATPKAQIILDRKKYQPGETAIALIRAEQPGADAWVTVESDGIRWQAMVPLKSKAVQIPIPVKKEFAPNAQVSVCFVRGKKFYQAGRRLSVDLAFKKLNIEIRPDRNQLKPGETVSYQIKTTGNDGKPVPAEVSLGVVDEAIYGIKKDTDDPLAEFYPKRYPSVVTCYSFPEIYLDGGEKSSTKAAHVDIRQKFLDTAFWTPSILTDTNGEATMRVKLPDNLTSWRATATAFSLETAVGKATQNVVVNKELMMRLSLPSFMTQRDKQRIVSVVQNTTDKPLEATVEIRAQGVLIEGAKTRTVRIEPKGSVTLDWMARAHQFGTASFTATVVAQGGLSDGIKLTVPVKPYGRDVVLYEAGEVREETNFVIQRHPNTVDGELKLSLTPSLASAMLGALDELVDFPYGCTEQTMSRFLPAVLVKGVLEKSGLDRNDLLGKIPEISKRSLSRLRMMQHYDGSWGWWEYDEGDPYMTALVLEGLWRAQQAGVTIDARLSGSGREWAVRQIETVLNPPKPSHDGSNTLEKQTVANTTPKKVFKPTKDWIYLAYAVNLYEPHPAAVQLLSKADLNSKDLDAEASALLALAWHTQVGRSTEPVPVQRRAAALEAALKHHLSRKEPYYGYEQPARVFEALVTIQPNSPLIPELLRSIMMARQGDMWHSTRDTAMILAALARYAEKTGELQPNYELTLYLNGEELTRLNITQANLTGVASGIRIPLSKLKAGENKLSFVKKGTGMAYFASQFRQVVSDETLITLVNSSGLRIERSYHKLELQQLEDGTRRLVASKKPLTSFNSGEVIRCRLRVFCTRPREFLWIEDPIPSNLRITENDLLENEEEWDRPWSRTVVLDDKAAFFFRRTDEKPQVIEYTLRAEAEGTCEALPASVVEMYAPSQRASSSAMRLEVRK